MQVSRIMSKDVQFVLPEATVRDAAEKMRAFDVGSLPVCRGSKLVGVVTDRDITIRATAVGLSPTVVTVADVMTGNATTCRNTDEVKDAAALMEELQVRRLPVVDNEDNLVGVVSLADLAERSGNEQLTAKVLEHVCEPPAPIPFE